MFLDIFDHDRIQQPCVVLVEFKRHDISPSLKAQQLPRTTRRRTQSAIAVLLERLRKIVILLLPAESVIKPSHYPAISGNYGSAGHVQTKTAVLYGAADGISQNQNCAREGIQFRDQRLGIDSKYEGETSGARLIIQLAQVLHVRASLIAIHRFPGSNFAASQRYGSANRRCLGPLQEPIGKGTVSVKRNLTSVRD